MRSAVAITQAIATANAFEIQSECWEQSGWREKDEVGQKGQRRQCPVYRERRDVSCRYRTTIPGRYGHPTEQQGSKVQYQRSLVAPQSLALHFPRLRLFDNFVLGTRGRAVESSRKIPSTMESGKVSRTHRRSVPCKILSGTSVMWFEL